MKTIDLSAIVSTLEAKGVKFELTGECSRVEYIDGIPQNWGETFYGVDLGISIASGIWAWYRLSLDWDTCQATSMTFRQRYNANVGSVLKSWRTAIKARERILIMTGLDFKDAY